MTSYYNEIDPAAAAVLRELVASGVIALGDVDERSIKDVTANDVRGYTQCHFFAGGGLWSVAARLAGWPDERQLWTGSCPCQPFSQAGKRAGTDDPRHLWPDFYRLIRAVRPPVVMGEQVAGSAGYGWFDGVGTDLASEDYASRAVDIPACAVDAPHQRNRLYWVAVDNRLGTRLEGFAGNVIGAAQGRRVESGFAATPDDFLFLNPASERRREGWSEYKLRSGRHTIAGANVQLQPNSDRGGRPGRPEVAERSAEQRAAAERADDRVFADADEFVIQRQPSAGQQPFAQPHARPLRNGSWWSDAEWIVSPLDGKARRAFTNISGLAYGLPGRLAHLSNDSFSGAQAEMIAYADATKNRPAEILREVRERVLSACSEASTEAGRRARDGLGSAEGFPASQVLLAFLREYDRRTDGGRSVLSIGQETRASMRGVWRAGQPSQSSCERGHLQQYPRESANSLRELSHILARHAATAGEAVGASDAKGLGFLTPSFPGRVDLWRVGGNAISPILAAEVIAAFLDAEAAE